MMRAWIQKIDSLAIAVVITLIAVVSLSLLLDEEPAGGPESKTEEFSALVPEDPGYIPANSLNLSPGRIIQDVPAQGRDLPEVKLTNTTDQPLTVELGFYPYSKTSRDGAPIFSTTAADLAAGRKLVRLGDYKFTIGPQKVRMIGAEVVGNPRQAEAFGVISAAFSLPRTTTQLPASLDGQASKAILEPTVRLSAPTWLKFKPAGQSSFRLEKPLIDQSSGGFLPQVDIKATGQASLEPYGEFLLYARGQLLTTASFGNNALIPAGQTNRVIADQIFSALAPGSYLLEARASGGEKSKISRRKFTIGANGLVVGSSQVLPKYSLRVGVSLPGEIDWQEPFQAQINLLNTGQEEFSPKLSIELVDRSSGEIVERRKVDAANLRRSLTLSSALGPVSGGTYTLRVNAIGPGGVELPGYERELEVSGPPPVAAPTLETSWLEGNPFAALGLGMIIAALLAIFAVAAIAAFSCRKDDKDEQNSANSEEALPDSGLDE